MNNNFLSLTEASKWASDFLNKKVTTSNISYLIQYGLINRNSVDKEKPINLEELKLYYKNIQTKETTWKKQLGEDLNWALSFDSYKEAETTKHIHRLHPYKGKFIPQLVNYFLDDHTDEFKQEVFFQKGDIVLDPFCGSGTTLIEANELGLHSIGIDISMFNSFISNVKIANYNIDTLKESIHIVTKELENYDKTTNIEAFEKEFTEALYPINKKYFPSPEFKIWVRKKEIDERDYVSQHEQDCIDVYKHLVDKYTIETQTEVGDSFLKKWYMPTIQKEISILKAAISRIKDETTHHILQLILSRTVRSCRATTHADLATLKLPQLTPYYCRKHGRICKPLFTLKKWWKRYTKDTLQRIQEFESLRTDTIQVCLQGDARKLNIQDELALKNKALLEKLKKQKIQGIFSSPPYVGLIDYHEQHAYAYELFGFPRHDKNEIGPLYKGQGREARKSYIEGIANVLNNSKPYLIDNANIFLVANDKYNLYPEIAKQANMQIKNQYKRPVLNRTERNKSAYCEIIFHLK